MTSNEGVKVVLHWLNGSRSQRILWLLSELKVPYELKIYHRDKVGFAPEVLKKVHPLGRSPVLTVHPADPTADPVVLAESSHIVEYLCDHWGANKPSLVPTRWIEGKEGQVGGETAAYLRYKFLLHFAEGSLMPYLVFFFVLSNLKSRNVPFFVRPITSGIANKINSLFTIPNVKKNSQLLEDFLTTPPATGSNGSGYLCGSQLTAVDILLSYPLVASAVRSQQLGSWEAGSYAATFPKLAAYTERIQKEPGYMEAKGVIEKLEGKYVVLPEEQ